MRFNALKVIKFVASGVVGIGTGKIVSGIIKSHVTPETLIDKTSITAAAWVISGMATKATKKYTDDAIDDVAKIITDYIDDFKTQAKLNRINNDESTFEQEGLDSEKFEKNDDGKWQKIITEEASETVRLTDEVIDKLQEDIDSIKTKAKSRKPAES